MPPLKRTLCLRVFRNRFGVPTLLDFAKGRSSPIRLGRAFVGLLVLALIGGHAWGATCAPATSGGSAPADWPSYCWFDFSSYSDTLARSAGGQNFTFTLNDGSTLSFTVNVTSTNTNALVSVVAPAWSGAAVGNTAFLGIPGKPILYTASPGTVQVTFSGITLTPPVGVTGGSAYSFVAADGESTNNSESLSFTTNAANWTILDKVPPISGSNYPAISNTGATFTETGAAGTVGGYIVGSTGATTVSTTLVAGGLQGAMFALRYSAISLNKVLSGGRVNPADQFTYTISAASSGSTLGTGTSTGSGNGPFSQTSSFITTPQALVLAERMASGSVSTLANYPGKLTCTNSTAGSTTPLPVNVATYSYQLPSIAFGDVIACTYTNTKLPPVLSITKSAPSPGLQVGTSSLYTLTVTNSGQGPATTAQVKDQLPSNLTFVSATGTGWSCSNAASLVTCAYSGNIPVGGTSTIAVTVNAPAAAGGASDTNYASIDPTSGTAAPPPGASCTTVGACASAGPNTVIYVNPVTDTGTVASGTAATAIANVAANDAVNGAAATLGSSGNSTVSQVGTWATGIALNSGTGAITTTAAVAPGTYSLQYQLCDKNTPVNCATVTDTVTVAAAINPVADTGSAVAGTASTPIANVAANDTVNGAVATLGSSGNATVAQSGTWLSGVSLNTATGAIATNAAVAPGTYSLQYQLCDKNTPVNCATVTDTVTVAAAIAPVADIGSAVAGTASTPIANVAANDTVNGAAATLGSSGNATVAQSGTWVAGFALNSSSGAITTTAAVVPGTYSLQYQLCDKNTPANCATVTDTVAVAASIVPVADSGSAVAGTVSTPIANVATNDKVNGAVATLGSSGNATVAQSGTWAAGFALNAASGAIATTAAVAPGTYSLQYQLCDKSTPANCATTTDTVTVTASIVPAPDAGTAVAGTASSPIANVATNDTVNGAAATLGSSGNATVAQSGTWATGFALNSGTGAITVTAAVAPGTYSLMYQLCDKNAPANCATSTDTVTVSAAINPVADAGSVAAGTAATAIGNVAANDTVNGVAATLGSSGNATVTQSGTWTAGIALNASTGAITTTASVAPGSYSVAYQLCDKNSPVNCATTTDTVTITANIVAVTDTGTAASGTASTPIANVAANDTVNGAQATLGSAGSSTVAQAGTWTAGFALNTSTGAVTMTAGVSPGSYALQYELCDKNTPANCATATDTVTVTASIVPVADTGSAVAGTASTSVANVTANDTVNGVGATLGSSGNATVAQSGTWPTGIALNTTTGAIATTAAVPPGSYSLQYKLCDKSTPANCATTTDTVTVAAAISPVADTGSAVAGTASTPIANVAANDTVNGAAATLGSSGNATVAQVGTWATGLALNTNTGAVSITAAVAPGSYGLQYQLCDKSTPANCATTTDTVTVAAAISPVADAGSAIAGTASTPIANVAANDIVNGAAATLGSSGNAAVAQVGTWTSGITLNTATGAITTTAAVAPGSYALQYQLCDKNTPANCATTTDTVTVAAAISPVADTGSAIAGIASTPIANVAANDTVNGAAATLGSSGNATVAQIGSWTTGIALNTSTGAITASAAVAPASYSLQYQLCDKSTPANCATTTDTVTVAAAINAVADSGTAVSGTALTAIANVAANDTVNGAAATLGSSSNATVAQAGTWTSGITLNTATGAVTTTAAVMPASYSLQYQLCDKSTPANCAITTDTVTVTAAINPVTDTGSAVAGTASTPITNVAANDTVNGAGAALGSSGNASVAQSGTWTPGIALNTSSGAITTTAAVAPGTYSLHYQLCDKSTPVNCATTTDTVTVSAAINPVADTGTAAAGTASTPIANVAANDTVNGAAATLGSSGNATIAQSGTWVAGISLNTGTGAVTTTVAVAPGTYSLLYQICDKNTPVNCATTTDTVTVSAAINPVADTGTAAAGTASTPIANVVANDTVNGTAASLASSGNATIAQSGTWAAGIALNTTTGAITTTAAVAPGSYSLPYQLCDKNTPANCASTTDTVTVTSVINAVADTGSAVAGIASTPIANVASNDAVNGAAATLGSSGNATVAQVGTWPAGIALNSSTGATTTTVAVPPGSYSLQYKLCDKSTPANCATTTDTVTVTASVVAVADTGSAVAGTASTPIANVAANDTVNGTAASLGSGGNATIAQAGTWTAGIALNTGTGAVTTTAAVAPGSYSLQYQLCDKNTPANCVTATDTVTVTASVVPVADTGSAVAGAAGTPIANVATNDTINGMAATLGSSGNASVAQSGTWATGFALNSGTGAITVTAAVAPGTYSLMYQLCDKSTPANCAIATDSVTVTASIMPVADSGTVIAGTSSTAIANVAANDMVNGAAAMLTGTSANATVAQSATWPNGIALVTSSGAVTVAATVAPGVYALQYQLCDKDTPINCATATDTVTVTASIAAVADSGTAVAGTASNPVANVAGNDTVNGAAATLGSSGNATVAIVGTWAPGITLNTNTGAIATTAAVAPGTYRLQYQLCDKSTPANCAVASDTITVTAAVVAAADTGSGMAGTASTAVANVANNDTINGSAAVIAGAGTNAVIAQSGTWPGGLTLNTGSGAVTVNATLSPGVYNVQYQLCDKNVPPDCATATVTVTVKGSIIATPESGSAMAGVASTPIANVAANDMVDGAAAILTGSGSGANATVAQIGTWPVGVALNNATGAISTTAAAAAGTFSLQYQLCDKSAPPNCANATDTLTIGDSIVVKTDPGTGVSGVASTPIANVAAGSTINGQPATLGAAGNATVAMAGNWSQGITLNPGTGAVSITASVPPGMYSFQINLCGKAPPANCAVAMDSITVTANIVPAAYKGSAAAGTASTLIASVAVNDTVNGAAVMLGAGGNATVSQVGSWPAGVTLSPAGAVAASAAAAPGNYALTYQLCDLNTPANCATAVLTITLTASISPAAASVTVLGGTAATAFANIAANGTIDGQPATLGPSGNATVAMSGTWPAGVVLDTTGGAVSMSANVLPGTYSLAYQLCDRSTPPNCATATDTLVVKNTVGGSLLIDKSASKTQVAVGDSIEYRIHVRNPGTAAVLGVKLNDTLPLGFKMIPGSVFMGINGAVPVQSSNPQGVPGPQLVWSLGEVVPTEIIEIDYRVQVAAGAERGTGVNQAQALGVGVTSAVATAGVQVTGGAFDTSACVVGKIYVDCNGNRVQDAGELGIPGVRLYFEDGTNLTSDENGNYSICGQRPITHVLKVDSTTLPAGSRLVVVSSRNAGDGDSLFVDLRDGELHRADFAEGSCTDKVMQDVQRRRKHGPLLSPLPAAGREHMGVDFESLPNGDTRISLPAASSVPASNAGGEGRP